MSGLRDQLLAIREESGKLTPQIVVDAARPSDSALHSKFEWDDSVAGEAFRRSQAAELIRSVRVTYLPANDGPQSSVRAFHAVKRPASGSVYDPIEEIIEDPLQRAILMRDMERDWRAMKKRWQNFTEFWTLITEDIAEAV